MIVVLRTPSDSPAFEFQTTQHRPETLEEARSIAQDLRMRDKAVYGSWADRFFVAQLEEIEA